jgi:DNA-binding GntR family transcriptional regulator
MAEPLYRRIVDDLRQQIESGQLGPGSQLPTEVELRELYHNASRNTIRDAIKPWSLQTTFYPMRFVEQGASRLLQAATIQQGAVKYISDSLDIKETGYRDAITVRPPDAHETAFFGLPSDGRVATVEICRTGFSKNGEPIRFTVTVFPADRNKFVINVGRAPDRRPEMRHPSAGPGRSNA